MAPSVWIRRIALTVAGATLAGTQLLSPAVADPATPQSSENGALLAHAPSEIRASCSSVKEQLAAGGQLPAGSAEALACRVESASGATIVAYLSFTDSAALRAAFTGETPSAPGQGGCSDGSPGRGTYTRSTSPATAGQVACFTTATGGREVAWTHEQSQTLGVLADQQLDLAQLYRIWTGLGPVTEDGPASNSVVPPSNGTT